MFEIKPNGVDCCVSYKTTESLDATANIWRYSSLNVDSEIADTNFDFEKL